MPANLKRGRQQAGKSGGAKVSNGSKRPAINPSNNSKVKKLKVSQRKSISVPSSSTTPKLLSDEDSHDSEADEDDASDEQEQEDIDPEAAAFLATMDQKAISNSRLETERIFRENKPARTKVEIPAAFNLSDNDSDDLSLNDSDLESISSYSSSSSLSSTTPPLAASLPSTTGATSSKHHKKSSRLQDSDSDEERAFEKFQRISSNLDSSTSTVDKQFRQADRMPIKDVSSIDGQLRILTLPPRHIPNNESILPKHPGSESESDSISKTQKSYPSDGHLQPRFQHQSPFDVVSIPSRKQRVQTAKLQIAALCSEITSTPEDCLHLLKRLTTYSMAQVPKSANQPKQDRCTNDSIIRQIAHLSTAAVFADILPSYRIRALTPAERAEKVSTDVQRRRDWESGLVGVYQNWLSILDSDITKKSEVQHVSLSCLCTLLEKCALFNFRQNIMELVISRLSRRSWDNDSKLCLHALNVVFMEDSSGEAALDAVRLLNRMIKERNYKIHPLVLSCLLNLRLREELDPYIDGNKPKSVVSKKDRLYMSKREKKRRKETKEIDRELEEASAVVSRAEKERNHTETLKLLFVLYFRILKSPKPSTALLASTLEGLSRYSHLINIDFFADLLSVLREISSRDSIDGQDDDGEDIIRVGNGDGMRVRLLCIITAFDLLSGQGEALNLDLDEFVQQLYAVLLPLSHCTTLTETDSHSQRTISDLLIRALRLALHPRAIKNLTTSRPVLSQAFCKRLLTCCLHWPASVVSKVITLLTSEKGLTGLLRTDDRSVDGAWNGVIDDWRGSNSDAAVAWEVLLIEKYPAVQVRLDLKALLRTPLD